MGFTKDRGGVTPHIRTINELARDASSSLSCTDVLHQDYDEDKTGKHTLRETE